MVPAVGSPVPETAGAGTPSASGCTKDDLYRGREGGKECLPVLALRLRTSVNVYIGSEGAGTLPTAV